MSKTKIIDIDKLISDSDIKKAFDKIKKRQFQLQETRNKEFYNTVVYSLFKRFEPLSDPLLKRSEENTYILTFTYEGKLWSFTINAGSTSSEVRVKLSEDKFGEYVIKSSASNTSSINFFNTDLSGLPEIIYNFAVYVARNFSQEIKNKPQQNLDL